nr:CotH kinase family protein [Treponema sp.]
MKKLLSFILTTTCAFFLFSCTVSSASTVPDDNPAQGGGTQKDSDDSKIDLATLNPKPYTSRAENLDFIYNPDVLGETTITISRKEWQKMLFFYDKARDYEQYVTAAKYNFTKSSNTWELNNVGIRVRGNTSRNNARPQTSGFEGYQNNYVQCHFKIDFEEFLEDDKTQGQKIAGSMKSVMLKHFKGDPTYTREVYGYNLFRQNGIWIAPRAAFTKLTIKIVDSDSKVETVNYGVYAMIESIDKQFLKARKAKAGGKDGECLESDDGNLWKCTGYAPLTPNPDKIGVETGGDFKNVNTSSSNPEDWTADYNGKNTPHYDLKTHKSKPTEPVNQFKTFMSQLSNLNGEANITAWMEKNFDVDLFLRTYAINVILGMWDDYWYNCSNYYFYFDKSGKAYFIPYDYDNILGCNINEDFVTKDPLYWGPLNDERPLINKILSVKKYKQLYQNYLLEYSKEGSKFYVTESQKRLNSWKSMVEPNIYSSQIQFGGECYGEWGDYFADWGYPGWCPQYKLFSGDDTTNYFKAKTKTIAKYCKASTIDDDDNGGGGDDNGGGGSGEGDDNGGGSGGGNENETDWNSIPVSSYLPIYVNGNSYTFIFVPTDYWVTYDGSQ